MLLRLFLALVFAAVVVGGIVGFNMFRASMIEGYFASMTPPPVTVSVSDVAKAPWQPGLEAIGTAAAAQGVQLAVEVSGVVFEVLFRPNDKVEAGQRLLQIDDRVERADLAAAEASLELSQESLERVQALRDRGVAPVSDLDVARADAANAQSQVVKLTAVLEQRASVAPFDGVVGIPQVEVGEFITPGTVYATLQNLDVMRVDFSIPEQQRPLVAIGRPVTVSSEIGGVALSGEITAIEPRIDPNSRLVNVRAYVDNPDGQLNPGQFMRIRVELPEEEGIIALPQTVVTSNLFGDSVYVIRREGEGEDAKLTVEQVFVQTGRRSGGLVEIVSGLEDGEQVVNAGQNRLTSGASVVIDNTVSPIPASPAG